MRVRRGEVRQPADPDHNGRWQTGFDMAGVVLLPIVPVHGQHHLQLGDRVPNTRIQFRRGRQAAPAPRRSSMLYIDFRSRPTSTSGLRASIWYRSAASTSITSRPCFYSVNRPELANRPVPDHSGGPPRSASTARSWTTWSHQFQVSSSLEDFGSEVRRAHERQQPGAVPDRRYAPGIGPDGTRTSRSRRAATSRSPATIWHIRFA